MMRGFIRVLAVAIGVVLAGVPTSDAGQPTQLTFRIERDVRIPMRDGIQLGAIVYRPEADNVRSPVIATLTPYMADRFHDVGKYFAHHGYVFASIDTRGRGDSGGELNPWFADGPDLYDALEWLAARPYANGKTATWGGSYSGKNQWVVAGLEPKSLGTIAPAAAGFVGFDMGMRRNIPFSYMQRWLALISGRSANRRLFEDIEYWNSAYGEVSRGEVSWRRFDELVGHANPIWRQWVDHPDFDAFWDAASPTDAQFTAIDIPVLSITGLYDDAQLGTLEFSRRHFINASDEGRSRHYLLIGPWDHAGTRTPRPSLAGLEFGSNSVLDMLELHREWYDWTLKGGSRPAVLKDRFVYYVTVANRWAHAPSIEAATKRARVLRLASPNASAGSVADRGRLAEEAESKPSADSYVYDPGLAGYNEGVEGENAVSENFLIDDRSFSRLNGDGLIYDSDPMSADTDLVGRPTARLRLSMDVPDTDIRVQLFEIQRSGIPVFLGQDLMRARYRKSPRRATLVTPGEIEEYLFDQFPFMARTLVAGSRIRLVISPASASIHQQRNRNSGGVVADETPKDNRIARVSVVLGPGGSTVSIPIGR